VRLEYQQTEPQTNKPMKLTIIKNKSFEFALRIIVISRWLRGPLGPQVYSLLDFETVHWDHEPSARRRLLPRLLGRRGSGRGSLFTIRFMESNASRAII